jgi:outer membrane protein assembly factor BamB
MKANTMKKNNRMLYICIVGVIALFVFAHYYQYPPLSLVQFGEENYFPLEKLWSQKPGNIIDDLSVTEDGTMVIVRTGNAFYALDKHQGNVIWKHRITHQAFSSPAVSSGSKIYVADGKVLWALDPENGQVIWSQPLSESGGRIIDVSKEVVLVNLVGSYVQAHDTQTGSLLWTIGVGRGLIHAYIDDNLVYIPDYGIRAVDIVSGKTIWTEGTDAIGSSSFSDGIIFYKSGNKITAFDVKKRIESWSLDLRFKGFGTLVVENGLLIVSDIDYLYAFDGLTGHLIWSVGTDFPKNPSVIDNTIYILEGFTRKIRAFDIDTGKEMGFIRTSFPYLLIVDRKDMMSSSNILLFSRGNEIFAFGK